LTRIHFVIIVLGIVRLSVAGMLMTFRGCDYVVKSKPDPNPLMYFNPFDNWI
jgi:hypothetical protein